MYGFFFTRFRSSCRPSSRNDNSSCESCWRYPLNWGAYFDTVDLKPDGEVDLALPHHMVFINLPYALATAPFIPMGLRVLM